MRVGIVGVGNWGKNLVRVFCNILGENNIIIYDVNQEELYRRKKEHPDIAVIKNFKELLLKSDIQAIVIATPIPTHYYLAKQALYAGKHVLVEKPMTIKSSEAKKLVFLAKKKRLKLMTDHLLLYHPVIEEIKKRINKNELGKVFYLYSQRLNLGIIRSEENVLVSLGAHDISVFLYLLDKTPEYVLANGGCYLQKKENIHDIVVVNLSFAGNTMAHSHLSWLDPHKVRKLTIVGSKKMLVFNDMETRNKLTIYNKNIEKNNDNLGFDAKYGDIFLPEIEPAEPLKKMAQHFIDCIRNNKIPISDGINGLKIVEILEKASQSLNNNGKKIKLKI